MTLDDNIRREEGSSKNTYIQNPELNIKSKYSFLDVRINGVWTFIWTLVQLYKIQLSKWTP